MKNYLSKILGKILTQADYAVSILKSTVFCYFLTFLVDNSDYKISILLVIPAWSAGIQKPWMAMPNRVNQQT